MENSEIVASRGAPRPIIRRKKKVKRVLDSSCTQDVLNIKDVLSEIIEDKYVVDIIMDCFCWTFYVTCRNTNKKYKILMDNASSRCEFLDLYYECIAKICEENKSLRIHNLYNKTANRESIYQKNTEGGKFYTRLWIPQKIVKPWFDRYYSNEIIGYPQFENNDFVEYIYDFRIEAHRLIDLNLKNGDEFQIEHSINYMELKESNYIFPSQIDWNTELITAGNNAYVLDQYSKIWHTYFVGIKFDEGSGQRVLHCHFVDFKKSWDEQIYESEWEKRLFPLFYNENTFKTKKIRL